ncbi:MAG: hypothetical protein ACF8R7_15820 [Phycisphaerales bacterium JB039]
MAAGAVDEVGAADEFENVDQGAAERGRDSAGVGGGEGFVELVGRRGSGTDGRSGVVVWGRIVGIEGFELLIELAVKGLVEEFVLEFIKVVDVRVGGHEDIVGRRSRSARGDRRRGARMRAPVGIRGWRGANVRAR